METARIRGRTPKQGPHDALAAALIAAYRDGEDWTATSRRVRAERPELAAEVDAADAARLDALATTPWAAPRRAQIRRGADRLRLRATTARHAALHARPATPVARTASRARRRGSAARSASNAASADDGPPEPPDPPAARRRPSASPLPALAYRTRQAARVSGVSASTVRRWCADGRLAEVRVGGCVLILADDLAAFLARHRIRAAR